MIMKCVIIKFLLSLFQGGLVNELILCVNKTGYFGLIFGIPVLVLPFDFIILTSGTF